MVELGYGMLNVELSLETVVVEPTNLIPRIASQCEVPPTVERRAMELAAMAVEAGHANGRKPSGVAAGCLYAAGKEQGAGLTQAAISSAAGVSANTIRERYGELREVLRSKNG